jgi:hypothetical protein
MFATQAFKGIGSSISPSFASAHSTELEKADKNLENPSALMSAMATTSTTASASTYSGSLLLERVYATNKL